MFTRYFSGPPWKTAVPGDQQVRARLGHKRCGFGGDPAVHREIDIAVTGVDHPTDGRNLRQRAMQKRLAAEIPDSRSSPG